MHHSQLTESRKQKEDLKAVTARFKSLEEEQDLQLQQEAHVQREINTKRDTIEELEKEIVENERKIENLQDERREMSSKLEFAKIHAEKLEKIAIPKLKVKINFRFELKLKNNAYSNRFRAN